MIRLAMETKTDRLEALLARLNAGSLTIYSGTLPATSDTAIGAQVPLLTYALETLAGEVIDDELTLTIPAPSAGLSTNTAAWGRLFTSADEPVLDGDCGIFGSNAFFILDSLSIAAGITITVLSMTIREPA